jgi:hypothetical protein
MWLSYKRGVETAKKQIEDIIFRGVGIKTLVDVATYNVQGLGNNARNKNRTNLEIAELGELFAAFIETAEVGLGLIVDDLVGTYVSTLGKSLAADFTSVWAFSGVSSFVSFKISKLRKAASTVGFFAWVWLNTRVGSLVDVEMGFLVETLRAILDRALIAFLSNLGAACVVHRSTLIARWSFLWWGALSLCLNSLHESIDFSTKIGIIDSVHTTCGADVLAVRSHKRRRVARNIPLWL